MCIGQDLWHTPDDPDLADDPEWAAAPRNDDTLLARYTCSICPIREACLQDALDRDEPYGIFGGKDPAERWEIKHPPVKLTRAELQRERRRARAVQGLPDDDPRHGTRTGYNVWSCRCAPCTRANADHESSRRKAGAA